MAGSGINKSLSQRSAAYKAILQGTPQSPETFRSFWKEEGVKPIDKRGDTILHFLAIHGNVAGFNTLLQECLVTAGRLKIKNVNGNTALHEAARFGRKEVAEIMLRKEKDLVFERNNLGETPLYVAAACGKKEVFAFLEKSNSDCMMRRNDGCTILHAAVIGECYSKLLCQVLKFGSLGQKAVKFLAKFELYFSDLSDSAILSFAWGYTDGICLAISMLESHPDLADKRNAKGKTALHLLAAKPESFRSGSAYTIRDLGRKPIPLQIMGTIIYSCIPTLYKESESEPVNSAEEPNNSAPISKLNRYPFTKFILSHPWFKKIDDAKQSHTVALMLAKKLIRREDWSHYAPTENEDFEDSQFGISPQKINRVPDLLIQATRLGISEVTLEILKVCPEAAYTLDKNGRNILHVVVEEKHRFLYDHLLKIILDKDRLLSDTDHEGNSVMHLAACLGSPLSTPPGAKQRMMWDVLWFKRVKYDCYSYLWQLQNSSGKTAVQVFEANHESLRKEAEKTTKEMANYVLVVSALIGTINFAAVFTIPGGFNDQTGIPIFFENQRREFDLLMFYLAGGLFSALLTMGTLLAIIFLRFETEDFYFSLPMKYLITITSMFYSAGFTILACCQAYVLETVMADTYVPLLLVVLLVAYILITLVLLDASYVISGLRLYVLRDL